MIAFELKKTLLGGWAILYACPRCKAALRSKLSEAGNTDTCPECNANFTVPGSEDRARVESEARSVAQKKQALKIQATKEREAARQLELARRESAKLLPVTLPPAPLVASKPIKGQIIDDRPVQCPKCGSSQVTANQTGFKLGNAAVGGILLGPIGLLGGMVGSKKVTITCLKCGTAFGPGEG